MIGCSDCITRRNHEIGHVATDGYFTVKMYHSLKVVTLSLALNTESKSNLNNKIREEAT